MFTNSPKQFILIGLSGCLAVSLGALGAHFLKSKIPSGQITIELLNGFDTGVKYHIYHTLGMLLIMLMREKYSSKYLKWAHTFFLWGIILFSGSLYFLCTRNLYGFDWLKVLGPITPIGGISFVLGWLCISLSALKTKS
jgi:uncharacterized membrane protein YgdD (TMEM256/DUF423 family)